MYLVKDSSGRQTTFKRYFQNITWVFSPEQKHTVSYNSYRNVLMCKRGLIANSRQEEKRLMWHSESTVWGLLQEHPPLTPLELRILQFVLWMSVFFHSFIFFSWHELETLIMSEELWNNPSTPEKEIQRSLNCLISHTPRQKGVSLDHRTLLCYWSHAKSGKGKKNRVDAHTQAWRVTG